MAAKPAMGCRLQAMKVTAPSQSARERLREKRLSRPRRAEQHDVALGQLDIVVEHVGAHADALVVVVHGDGKIFTTDKGEISLKTYVHAERDIIECKGLFYRS